MSLRTENEPPKRSSIALTTNPDASSTARYLPPGLTPAIDNICDNVSQRKSRIRLWSLLNQKSHTLCKVGSIVVNIFEYLRGWDGQNPKEHRDKLGAHFASFLFLYLSLLYSVFLSKFVCWSICN